MKTGLSAESGVEAVKRVCAEATSPDELLAELSNQFRRIVPHDGSLWMAVDPVTLLSTAPSRVEGLDASLCDTFWHLEFHEQDTGLFVDLARDGSATAMRLELGDRIGRSPRYRDFLSPQGYGDELRAAFRSGDSTWGVVSLYREQSLPTFTADDVAFVKASSRAVGEALRTHVRATAPWLGQPSGPGLVVLDRHGRVISANEEVIGWLQELWPLGFPYAELDLASLNLFDLRHVDLSVPTPIYALVSRALAVAAGRERAPARLRLRNSHGRWIVLHATAINGPGTPGGDSVALIIEAAKTAEIAPIIIDAYSLTPRERDVLGAVTRGASTTEIARALSMSPHTVRDHLKTVFEKVGVSSRGELVARLFGEHYAEPLHDTMVHTD